jgi:peptide/nickel transport system permease protein
MDLAPNVTRVRFEATSWDRMVAFVRRMFRNRLATVGTVLIALLVLCAVFADQISPYAPNRQYYRELLQPPSAKHLLGTDGLGRDQLSRILYGSRVSLLVGAISIGIGCLVGVALGLVAGYRRGFLDTLIMRAMDGLMSFPTLVLAIFLVTFLGPSMVNAMIAVGIIYIPGFARIVRANVLSLREKEFVEASRAIGLPTSRIMWRHILPNCLSPIIVQATLGVGRAILIEASLSFLGLGVQRPEATWGNMIADGREYITSAPWTSTFPGLAILLTVLGFNFLGDGLREALDPRLRERL